MFTSARLKLTAWYLVIIMLVSVIFSLAIYSLINQDYNRIEQMQQERQDREESLSPYYDFYRLQLEQQGLSVPPMPAEVDLEPITQSRVRLQAILILINFIILGISAILGYFLAGRTLQPIKEMVDDQNRFITDASHELRTPLTSLKSEIEVYLRDKSLSLAEAKKLLTSNLEEVNKLQYLSDNLIKLTQFKRVNNDASFVTSSLLLISAEAVKKVAPLAKQKKINLKNEVTDLLVDGDKPSLVELFVILLDNAIKYSPEQTEISLNSNQGDHFVTIKVKDQGIGIDKQDLPHLFDRFYRADKSRTKSEAEGYGLGLSIAKQIVDKHKGSIKVESLVDQGTTFIIHLPLAH